MRRALSLLVLPLLSILGCGASTPRATAASPSPPAPNASAQKLERKDGFLPLLWDESAGRIFLEVSRIGEDLLYLDSLVTGFGSSNIGLDRSEFGRTRLVRFEKVGAKLLLVERNTQFRAGSGDAAERRSVEQSFPESVLWAFPIEPGKTKTDGAGRAQSVTVDATGFFVSDVHGVALKLREAEQGKYKLDANRSAVAFERTKAFPKNSDVEATLTFAPEEEPGRRLRELAPMPDSVTVRVHHSFVALPDPGFELREGDPRVGIFALTFQDFATPFGAPLDRRFLMRHRLAKKETSSPLAEPQKPIVYYVDPGVPEPLRSAIVEGASWWSAAFEAAGFKNAFEVRVLPEGVDPLDVRYNTIAWVHRSTRGWSYGLPVIDPRTGEILRAAVVLGSLRVRQDVLIARGLVGEADEGDDASLASLDPRSSPRLLALARLRQLAAHEVGHSLGLEHNMAASTAGRASVMDYPSPRVKIAADGSLDLSDAYARGIGDYDKLAIRYAYGDRSSTDPAAALDAIRSGAAPFVRDEDARPVSAAHPLGATWDDGEDPVRGLEHELKVRRIALDRFGLASIRRGEPLATLEEALLPLYLHHRYQLEAAIKSLGGLRFAYEVKKAAGAKPELPEIVPAATQRRALELGLATLDPAVLALPERILALITPRPPNYEAPHMERFDSDSDPVFDPLSAAAASAEITLRALLDPHRAARLVQFHARDAANPGLPELLDALVRRAEGERARAATVAPFSPSGASPGLLDAIARAVRAAIVRRLIALASDAASSPEVRADTIDALRALDEKLGAGLAQIKDASERASRRAARDEIQRFLSRPAPPSAPPRAPHVPPGAPI
jgi:hypothetical protein